MVGGECSEPGGSMGKASNLCPLLSMVTLFAWGLRCHIGHSMLQTIGVASMKTSKSL